MQSGRAMAVYYKGAGIGTWWHQNDARAMGLVPQAPAAGPSLDRLMKHIVEANVNSPYVSLTLSYSVAYNYALLGEEPSKDDPAYVYEVEISDGSLNGFGLLDPVREVANAAPQPPADISYQHDGDNEFLLGVIKPGLANGEYVRRDIKRPPPGQATPRSANLTRELETLVFALRDAEILVSGSLPKEFIKVRHEIVR